MENVGIEMKVFHIYYFLLLDGSKVVHAENNSMVYVKRYRTCWPKVQLFEKSAENV